MIVPAYGDEDGWDKPAGVKTEIVPLTRPFANYAGNTFRGQLLVDGKPAAGADVEVEYFNRDGKYEAPNDYFVTQVVKTDAQGIFAFTAPWAGWWGFAALTDADYKLKEAGAEKDVELGAVLWTEFTGTAGEVSHHAYRRRCSFRRQCSLLARLRLRQGIAVMVKRLESPAS